MVKDGESQVPGIDFVDYTGQGHHLVIYYGSGSNYYYFEYLWKVLLAVNYTAVMKDDPKQPDDQVTVEQLIKSMVIYGSPKTVAEKLLAFRERTGPFGGLLMAAMDGSGANRSREWESMTLLSQEVMPVIRRALGR